MTKRFDRDLPYLKKKIKKIKQLNIKNRIKNQEILPVKKDNPQEFNKHLNILDTLLSSLTVSELLKV